MIGILQYGEIIWIVLWDVEIEFFQWDHEQNGGKVILKLQKSLQNYLFWGVLFFCLNENIGERYSSIWSLFTPNSSLCKKAKTW